MGLRLSEPNIYLCAATENSTIPCHFSLEPWLGNESGASCLAETIPCMVLGEGECHRSGHCEIIKTIYEILSSILWL